MIKAILKFLRFHIHEYGKWEYFSHRSYYITQIRYCKKCNKAQLKEAIDLL